jgi:hypothetical protein
MPLRRSPASPQNRLKARESSVKALGRRNPGLRGRDNRGVIATELEDRARETGTEARADGAAHRGRTVAETTATQRSSTRTPPTSRLPTKRRIARSTRACVHCS